MHPPEPARAVIHGLYVEGESDWIFFTQLLGYVAYDEEDEPFGKSKQQCLNDACRLAMYLVGTGDFAAGRCTGIREKPGGSQRGHRQVH